MITGEVTSLQDNEGDKNENIYANEYQLYDPTTHALSFKETQDQFRINSASTSPSAENNVWPLSQEAAQAVMDADGDLTVSYDGYGPDVSFLNGLSGTAATQIYNAVHAANLDQYLNLSGGSFGNTGDVDTTISSILLNAESLYPPQNGVPDPRHITDADLARLRDILENVFGLLRGEADGAMFSQFSANPGAVPSVLTSDNVANNQRDGSDATYLIAIDPNSTGGDLTMHLDTPEFGVDTPLGLVYTNNVLDVKLSLINIDATLQAATKGLNWNFNDDLHRDGTIQVRLVPSSEILGREGTAWDVTTPLGIPDTTYFVFEITFQGELHDAAVGMFIKKNGLNPVGSFASCVEEYAGDSGTVQNYASIAMGSSGNFVEVWNQTSQTTTGGYSNTNLYFRQFQEGTDTAGPLVTDFLMPTTNATDEQLNDGDTVREQMPYVVVTFDQSMMTTGGATGANSVLNPHNWALMLGGTLVSGGVDHISYGMNEANTELGMPASNKWEAIIWLKGSGNSQTQNSYLLDGHYEARRIDDSPRCQQQRLGTNRIPAQRRDLQPFLRRRSAHRLGNPRQYGHHRRSDDQPQRRGPTDRHSGQRARIFLHRDHGQLHRPGDRFQQRRPQWNGRGHPI